MTLSGMTLSIKDTKHLVSIYDCCVFVGTTSDVKLSVVAPYQATFFWIQTFQQVDQIPPGVSVMKLFSSLFTLEQKVSVNPFRCIFNLVWYLLVKHGEPLRVGHNTVLYSGKLQPFSQMNEYSKMIVFCKILFSP